MSDAKVLVVKKDGAGNAHCYCPWCGHEFDGCEKESIGWYDHGFYCIECGKHIVFGLTDEEKKRNKDIGEKRALKKSRKV